MIAIGAMLVIWLLCTAHLNHRCALGYKWFEHYGGLIMGALAGVCIFFCRRLWLGSLLAVALFVIFFQFAIPSYLTWIHGPNHPYFPAAEAESARIMQDLLVIKSAESAKPEKSPR